MTTLDVRTSVLHTYDINCQFAPYMWNYFDDLPPGLQDIKVRRDAWTHLVPKMHLLGHTRKCHAPYSLNYASGAARTCGEAIERMWALMNGIAASVREMGQGFRSDWIDSHMAHHNWLKHTKMGMYPPSTAALCSN
jgi:hypothetical protein